MEGGHSYDAAFSWQVHSLDSSSMFISVHVGATSDLCAREGKQHSYEGQSTVLALYNHNQSECQ